MEDDTNDYLRRSDASRPKRSWSKAGGCRQNHGCQSKSDKQI
nr:MAG TPA: hypothetical protein [Bacteriophage sp.]